jgi:hypothetical protein
LLGLASITFMLLTRYRDPGIIPRGLEFSHNPGAPSFPPCPALSRQPHHTLPGSSLYRRVACCRSDRVRVVVGGGGLARQSLGLRTQEATRDHQDQRARRKPTHQVLRYQSPPPPSILGELFSDVRVRVGLLVGLCPTRLMQTRATFTDHREPFTAPCATTASTASTTTISFSAPFASSSLFSSLLLFSSRALYVLARGLLFP